MRRPKGIKTKKSVAKRFKITASGKVLRSSAGKRHLAQTKSPKRRSTLYRYASDALDHGRQYAYRDRRVKKRTFRYLWQIRINAAAREAGMTYSRFIEGLKAAKVALDRKILSDLAATDVAAFNELVKI